MTGVSPWSIRAEATVLPMNPAPPVMSTFTLKLLSSSDPVSSRTRPRPSAVASTGNAVR